MPEFLRLEQAHYRPNVIAKHRYMGADPTGHHLSSEHQLQQEFEEKQMKSNSFNVLFVEVPKPPILENPHFQKFAGLLRDTFNFAKPILRLGIPETSMADKCPYHKQELHPSIVLSPKVQHSLSLMEHPTWFEEPRVHLRKPEYLGITPQPWLVLVSNLTAYYLILSYARRPIT